MKRLQALILFLCLLLLANACVKKQDPGAPSGTQAGVATGVKAPAEPEVDLYAAPVPPKAEGNPLVGAKLFVDPESQAMLRTKYLRNKQPDQAAVIQRIADQPQAIWFGEWNTNIYRAVEHFVSRASREGAVAVMIAYNIPLRDCGQHSAGGLSNAREYGLWIRRFSKAIGDRPAVVVLEPDALGHLDECLTPEQQKERLELLTDAVRVLRMSPRAAVYLDAGHARWVEAEVMAERLQQAGIEHAHGFALNTSNYVSTEENLAYGKKLSELVGGAHFVIDTSRNGAGPAEKDEWCNPPGRKIGAPPTTSTGEALVDGYLWLKRPGESDGECNGGPRAGVFWDERAIELAQ